MKERGEAEVDCGGVVLPQLDLLLGLLVGSVGSVDEQASERGFFGGCEGQVHTGDIRAWIIWALWLSITPLGSPVLPVRIEIK